MTTATTPLAIVEAKLLDLIKAYGDGIPLHLVLLEIDAREMFPNNSVAYAEIRCAEVVLGALTKLHSLGTIGYHDHGIGKIQWELAPHA